MKKKYNKPSEKTVEEASKIARGIQKPGQTKEQTKLIAQGIQKGIELYKKQQKVKARELDKKLKQARNSTPVAAESESNVSQPSKDHQPKFPWILLTISWVVFAIYILFMQK